MSALCLSLGMPSPRLAGGGGGIPFPTVTGLVMRLEGGTVTGLTDGDPVPAWPDASGNGHSPANATVASRPEWRQSALNGLPAVVFDGVDDRLTGLSLSLAHPQVFIVLKSLSSSDVGLLGHTGASPQFLTNHYGAGNLGYWNNDGPEIVVASPGFTTGAIAAWTKSGATATVRHNGVPLAANSSQGSAPILIAGITGINDTAALSAEISAIIVVDSAVSAAAEIEAYLDAKYFNGTLGL